MWLSLVEYLFWEQGVTGSNPVIPRVKLMIAHFRGNEKQVESEIDRLKAHSAPFRATLFRARRKDKSF